MNTALPSSFVSEGADKRSKAFKALWEIVFSGVAGHSPLTRKVNLISRADCTDWPIKYMPLPPATAYEILKRGLPSRVLIVLGDYLGMGRGAVADLVGLDRSIAYRKGASAQPLPMHVAESVLRLLELQCLAEDIFESLDAASAWLCCAHPMLDGEAPFDRARSAYGVESVKEILAVLKYGGVV